MPTHGSLTKAGKVRGNTPKIEKTNKKVNYNPKQKMRRNYAKRILNTKPPKWDRNEKEEQSTTTVSRRHRR